MNTPLWLCGACSLVLHGVLAASWSPGHAGGPGAARLPSGAGLEVRLAAADATRAAEPLQPTSSETRPTSAPAPAPAATDAPATEGHAQAPVMADEVQPTAPAHGLPADPLDEYVPRPQLSLAPLPRSGVELAYPANGPDFGRFALTLTLYIDETGQVRHAEVSSDTPLPEALREAALHAFGSLQFSPGEKDGQVVKSRLRLEVVYESLAVRDGQ